MTVSSSRTRFRVEGMDCASCASKIDTAIRRMPSVADVNISVVAGTMTVEHDGSLDSDAVSRKVSGLGYRTDPAERGDAGEKGDRQEPEHRRPAENAGGLEGLHGHDHAPQEGPWWATAKARLTIACGVALAVAFVMAKLLPPTQPWGFIVAMAIGLIPIARRALAGAMNGSPFTIETLMTIAAVGAVVIGAAEEAAVVVVLFLVGELLEGIATGRARA